MDPYGAPISLVGREFERVPEASEVVGCRNYRAPVPTAVTRANGGGDGCGCEDQNPDSVDSS